MIIKIKKLDDDAVIPSYAKEGDAGMDLTATSISVKDTYVEYGTGLALEIPDGYVGMVFPRSSVSKKDLLLCNSVGIIDAGYRGEVKLRFKCTKELGNIRVYDIGERVGQLIVIPIPTMQILEVDELSSTDRGEGGFGSTGN